MGLVLGLSVTSKDIRAVLVDGLSGEGDQVAHAVLDISDTDALDALDAEEFLDPLLIDGELHAVGLTWSADAEPAATKVRAALSVLGGAAPMLDVPDIEATKALALGIADITGNHYLVACVVEPDHAVIARVDWQQATAERFDNPDIGVLAKHVCAAAESARPRPRAFFVLGSGDTDALVDELADTTERPVITAAEANLALPRGAALAAAQAATALRTPPPGISKTGVVSSVLAGAVVVFVVSVSVAVWPHLASHLHQQSHIAVASRAQQPHPPALAAKISPESLLDRQFIAKIPRTDRVVAPPVNVAPPVAAPVAPTAPPPRLRDRIIQRMGPILGRLR
jgi:hypothetical protein